jgi:hypothetical protein
MYFVVILPSILGLTFSWLKFRSILHPHFIITSIMFIMFYSDFMIRGYNDRIFDSINEDSLFNYQLIIVFITGAIYFTTYLISTKSLKNANLENRKLLAILGNEEPSYIFPLFSWGLLILEILKRLSFTEWSIVQMLVHSFGPRFFRPWANINEKLGIGDDRFLFTFLGLIYPLAGVILGVDLVTTKNNYRRIFSFIGYTLVLVFAVGDGTRTPAVIIVLAPLVVYMLISKSRLKKFLAIILSVVIVAVSTSLMYNNRDFGFQDSKDDKPFLVYHQDDTYYRAVHVFDIESKTTYRWDPVPFFQQACLNFIPRVVWPDKPTLGKSYWGEFKPYWITISFIGELVAMFGLYFGSLSSIVIGIACFLFIRNLYINVNGSYYLLYYILGMLYVYQIFRSLLNITQFIYMFLLFYIVLRVSKTKLFSKGEQPSLRDLSR